MSSYVIYSVDLDDVTERSAWCTETLETVVVESVGRSGNGICPSSVFTASVMTSVLKSLVNLSCVSSSFRDV